MPLYASQIVHVNAEVWKRVKEMREQFGLEASLEQKQRFQQSLFPNV
ncbi:MAG TPA: hypothetical protein VFM05_05615 [Candidatus Saccharimonadales bacterium]|nr:hypothetical protein [Candidatus Saccharimonadales bacterium]